MNEFLKYLKMIPVIIYPYIYVLILAVFFLFVGVLPEDTTDISLLVLLIIAVIYNLYSFVIVIVNAVQTAKGKLTAGQAARMNLIIKGIQIPAYIMHFILGFIGLAMSVWGIGFLLWAVLIDLLTILPFFFLSGMVIFRMLRVARIFHLFRLNARYDSFNVITTVLYEKRNQIISSVFIVLILMLASSLCMYSVEHDSQPEVFRSRCGCHFDRYHQCRFR